MFTLPTSIKYVIQKENVEPKISVQKQAWTPPLVLISCCGYTKHFFNLIINKKDLKGFAKTTIVPHECPG